MQARVAYAYGNPTNVGSEMRLPNGAFPAHAPRFTVMPGGAILLVAQLIETPDLKLGARNGRVLLVNSALIGPVSGKASPDPVGGRRAKDVGSVPVTAKRFVDGAARRGADAIILDLEDSVAASEKERARALVPEAAEIVSRGGADVVVRINRPLRLAVRDIEAAVGPRVLALALPKVDGPEHVRLLAEIVDEIEAGHGTPGTTRLIAMVETAAALFRIAEIARAHPRLCALNLGAEDFALSAGILPDAEGLFMPKQMAVFAARAAGIMPLGFIGTVAEYHDLDGFRQTIRRSRRLGFIGASVIHPSQIPILNEEFRPGAEEVDHARRVVAAYDKALAEGVGAVTVDGKMIDVPIVERARLLLDREAAIAAREAKMRAPD
jgi:citrate lyase subunit beta/citryl-CoA lyase